MCAGSCGDIQGAKIAEKAKMVTRTTPTAASGLRRATRGSEMARVDMVGDDLATLIYKMRGRSNVGLATGLPTVGAVPLLLTVTGKVLSRVYYYPPPP